MNSSTFSQQVSIRWSDMDVNGHLRHSVYYDFGAQARIDILHQQGITLQFMQENHIGPILFREECKFRKEIRLGDEITIETELSGLRKDCKRFSIIHTFYREETLCATIEIDGAWMDTLKRKLCAPPDQVVEAFDQWPQTENFKWI